MKNLNYSIGLWASILSLSTFIIWIISFVAIASSAPLFYWTNLEEYITYSNANGQFFHYLAKSFMIVFALSFMVLVFVFEEMTNKDRKILARIAVGFALMFAVLASMHYFVQVSAVRFAFQNEDFEGLEQFLQAKPSSVLSSINMLAWTIFLGLSNLFLFFALKTKAAPRGIRLGSMISAISCLFAGFGYLFQIDIITFVGINLGMGLGMMILCISAGRHFYKQIRK